MSSGCDQFTFGEKVNSPDATHLPVRLAVAIMKDRDGKIVLDVPVNSNLADPRLRIGKVVTRAIVNILEKVATSPFSLLGAMSAAAARSWAIRIVPGSAELSPDSMKKLDTMVKALMRALPCNWRFPAACPASDRDGLQRIALDKEIRTRQWQSLGKADATPPCPTRLF